MSFTQLLNVSHRDKSTNPPFSPFDFLLVLCQNPRLRLWRRNKDKVDGGLFLQNHSAGRFRGPKVQLCLGGNSGIIRSEHTHAPLCSSSSLHLQKPSWTSVRRCGCSAPRPSPAASPSSPQGMKRASHSAWSPSGNSHTDQTGKISHTNIYCRELTDPIPSRVGGHSLNIVR